MKFLHQVRLCHEWVSLSVIFWQKNTISCNLSGLPNGIGNYALMVMMLFAQDSPVQLNIEPVPANAVAMRWISELCLIFWLKQAISPTLSTFPIALANIWYRIRHNATHKICSWFCGWHEAWSSGSTMCSFARDQPASVSYCDTAIGFHLAWLYCPMGLPDL